VAEPVVILLEEEMEEKVDEDFVIEIGENHRNLDRSFLIFLLDLL